MNNYSVLIDCPDSYLDILNIFFVYLQRNWKTRKNHIYICTQESEIEHPDNVTFIKCGNELNCIQRSLEAIRYIKEDYVLIVGCDDFFQKQVEENEIEQIVDFMKKHNIKYTQLWKMKNKEHRKYPAPFPGLYYCNKKARYSRSLMANIWNKEEYISLFASMEEDGWHIEEKWLKECYESEPGFFDDYCYYDLNPLKILHAVSKGCWIRGAFHKNIKNGIPRKMLCKRKKLGLKLSLKHSVSMFLFNHISSKSFFKLKRKSKKFNSYTTHY